MAAKPRFANALSHAPRPLQVTREDVRLRLTRDPKLAALIAPRGAHFALPGAHRGALKRGLLAAGYPVDDIAGLVDGEPLDVPIKADSFTPYPYQTAADLADDAVVVYEGARRATLAPVTITTYSMVSNKGGGGATSHASRVHPTSRARDLESLGLRRPAASRSAHLARIARGDRSEHRAPHIVIRCRRARHWLSLVRSSAAASRVARLQVPAAQPAYVRGVNLREGLLSPMPALAP